MEDKLYLAVFYSERVADSLRYNTVLSVRQKIDSRAPKKYGFKIEKAECLILESAFPNRIMHIQRDRIVDYEYITVDEGDVIRRENNYFIFEVKQAFVDWIVEKIRNKEKGFYNPGISLWKNNMWCRFPKWTDEPTGEFETRTMTSVELFTGKTEIREYQVEKTRPAFKEEFAPNVKTSLRSPVPINPVPIVNEEGKNPAGYPVKIIGNGMVLEWKQTYADKPHCWWIQDEYRASKKESSSTYRHYSQIKYAGGGGARWSKNFNAWYWSGSALPPKAWLDLVGYKEESTVLKEEVKASDVVVLSPRVEELEKIETPYVMETFIAKHPTPTIAYNIVEKAIEKMEEFIRVHEDEEIF